MYSLARLYEIILGNFQTAPYLQTRPAVKDVQEHLSGHAGKIKPVERAAENLVGSQVSRYRETQAGDRETGQTKDGVKTPEYIEAEICQHALDLAEPGGLGG